MLVKKKKKELHPVSTSGSYSGSGGSSLWDPVMCSVRSVPAAAAVSLFGVGRGWEFLAA